jgi:hypothetical protein
MGVVEMKEFRLSAFALKKERLSDGGEGHRNGKQDDRRKTRERNGQ